MKKILTFLLLLFSFYCVGQEKGEYLFFKTYYGNSYRGKVISMTDDSIIIQAI